MTDTTQRTLSATTMPSSFLEEIAHDLLEQYGRNMMHVQVILPGASATQALRAAFKTASQGKALMLPGILSMDDFVNRHAAIRRAGPEKTLVILHQAFCKRHHSSEALAAFLPLAQQLLSDFDLILRAGRKPEEVFAGLKNWESVGAGFADFMDEEQKQLMRNFSGLFRDNLPERRMRFLRLWEDLPAVFSEMEATLLAEDLGTAGMVYRNAAHRLRQLPAGYSGRFYFAGFSSLSELESGFMEMLAEAGLADFAWDLMPQFHHRRDHEISQVYRRLEMREAFRPSLKKWAEKSAAQAGTRIRQVKCPGMSGMVQWILKEDFSPETSTVFILTDPAMVQLLAGMGKLSNGKNLHFSMGFPLAYTPLARWVYKLMAWLGRRNQESGFVFFPLMEDRHFRLFFPEAGEEASRFSATDNPSVEEIRVLSGLPEWFFAENPARFLRSFLSWAGETEPEDASDALLAPSFRCLRDLMQTLVNQIPEDQDGFTFPVLQAFLQAGMQSAALISGTDRESSWEAMGLFEGRMLDFTRVIIAPGHEGLIPAAGPRQSMLPESVRRAFGLPLRQSQSEDQAWQFYRLCKRASEVVFLVSGSEETRRSRFLEQIEFEAVFPFSSETLRFNHQINRGPEISCLRTPEQMEKVFSYRSALKGGKPLKKFSPTSLHALITCPLRFHYQKIMGLKEPDSFSRIEMGAHDFGKFVHEGIQLLLKKYGQGGKNFTAADYASMEQDWDLDAPVVWDSLPEKTSIGRLIDFPIEAALGRIMAMRFFAFMKKQPGHRWLNNEYDFPDLSIGRDGSWWSVSGRADIVLEFKDHFCFLDLKTGAFQEKGKLLLKTDEEGNPDEAKIISGKDYFQMLAYNRMAASDPRFKGKKVLAGLFYLAKPASEIAFPLEKVVEADAEPDFYARFDQMLIAHLEALSNPEMLVKQTEDAANCTYCSFNAMCRRS